MGDMEKKEGPRMYKKKFRRRCHLPVGFYLIAHVATESYMGVGDVSSGRPGTENRRFYSYGKREKRCWWTISNLCHNRLNFLDLYEENLVTVVIRS